MNPLTGRRRLLQSGLGLAAGLALNTARGSQDCTYFGRNLTVHHPWTRATAAGDKVAMLFMTVDEVTRDDRLIGVRTPFSSGADMAGTQTRVGVDLYLPKSATTVLSQDGVYLRLLGLKHRLHTGREYPITLMFEQAGEVKASVSVDFERLA